MITNRSRRRQKNSDWEAEGNVQEILRKPSLFNGDYLSLTNKPVIPLLTGSVSRIPKITAANVLGQSCIEDNANRVLVSGAIDDGSSTLQINGDTRVDGTLTSNYLYAWAAYADSIQCYSHSPYVRISTPNYGFAFKKLADDQNLYLTQADSGSAIVGTWNRVGDYVAAGAITATNLFSGVYTPTLTALSNVSSLIAVGCRYTRLGDVVTVTGRIQGDSVAGHASGHTFMISLPVASDLITGSELSGLHTLHTWPTYMESGSIFGDPSTNQALFGFKTQYSAFNSTFTFQYIVQ